MAVGLAQGLSHLIHYLPGLRRHTPEQTAPSPAFLATLIEGEIIPRLLVASRSAAVDEIRAEKNAAQITPAQAEAFAALVLTNDAYGLLQHVEQLIDDGVAVESVLIDLLAPAARELGAYWEEDRCDFVDVTMGLWRLQELVHELATRIVPVSPHRPRDRRALFAALPGEQHGFGLVMVEEFFRGAGWNTVSDVEGSRDELLRAVRRQAFDIVALSVSCEQHLECAAAFIGDIREQSRNPGVGIFIGGRVMTERPELALLVGADATAPDARQAVLRAELFVDALASREVIGA